MHYVTGYNVWLKIELKEDRSNVKLIGLSQETFLKVQGHLLMILKNKTLEDSVHY